MASHRRRSHLQQGSWGGPPRATEGCWACTEGRPGARGLISRMPPAVVKWTVRLVAKSCPLLCDPMDWSPPGSSAHEISQARILEWVAVSFSMKPTGGSITQLPCHSVEITLSFVQQFPKVPSGTESQSCTATNCWLTFLIASYHSWLTHHSPAPTRCYTFKWTTHLCPRGLLRESNIPGLYLSRKKGLPVCPAKILERKML